MPCHPSSFPPPQNVRLCHPDSHPPRPPTATAEMACVSSCLVFSINLPRHYPPCCAADCCPPRPRQSAVFGCGSCACRTRDSCQRSIWRCTAVRRCGGGGVCMKGGGGGGGGRHYEESTLKPVCMRAATLRDACVTGCRLSLLSSA